MKWNTDIMKIVAIALVITLVLSLFVRYVMLKRGVLTDSSFFIAKKTISVMRNILNKIQEVIIMMPDTIKIVSEIIIMMIFIFTIPIVFMTVKEFVKELKECIDEIKEEGL